MAHQTPFHDDPSQRPSGTLTVNPMNDPVVLILEGKLIAVIEAQDCQKLYFSADPSLVLLRWKILTPDQREYIVKVWGANLRGSDRWRV